MWRTTGVENDWRSWFYFEKKKMASGRRTARCNYILFVGLQEAGHRKRKNAVNNKRKEFVCAALSSPSPLFRSACPCFPRIDVTLFFFFSLAPIDLENLEKRRSPSPNVEAIYFAMPTEDSVRRIIRDFKTGRPATYSAAHLFFLAGKE